MRACRVCGSAKELSECAGSAGLRVCPRMNSGAVRAARASRAMRRKAAHAAGEGGQEGEESETASMARTVDVFFVSVGL